MWTDEETSEVEPQFGVCTFAFKSTVPSPATAYCNKWGEWTSMWFYYKVPLDEMTQSHPLVVREVGLLKEQPPAVEVDGGSSEAKAHIAMLREVSKVFGTRDIVEEYIACKCFPVRKGWSISSWAGKERRVGWSPDAQLFYIFWGHKER